MLNRSLCAAPRDALQLQPARTRARRRRSIPARWALGHAAGDAGKSAWLEGFRRAVLKFRVNNDALSEGLRSRRLGGRHSGFSAHNVVGVPAEDAEEGLREVVWVNSCIKRPESRASACCEAYASPWSSCTMWR